MTKPKLPSVREKADLADLADRVRNPVPTGKPEETGKQASKQATSTGSKPLLNLPV